MPQGKNNRGQGLRQAENGRIREQQGQVNPPQAQGQRQRQNGPRVVQCCAVNPQCDREQESIILNDPGDAVKILCNNENCDISGWMHGDCFQAWEQQVLAYLRSCGRARSWSEKQRLQNLWTKKGYDLAYKACDCKCSRGHLRKDLDYIQPPKTTNGKKKGKKKQEKTLAVVCNKPKPAPTPYGQQSPVTPGSASSSGSSGSGSVIGAIAKPQLRLRTSSFGSTGSSPPSSAGTPPLTPLASKLSKFDFFADQEQAAAGNIFKHRTDFSAFSVLPRHQQNPYHIKMEDEGPHGNDDTRCFILSNLSSHQVTTVNCVICCTDLPVFDRYPLIDGTFFLSPLRYNSDLKVLSEHNTMFLNAVCMRCLEGNREMRCVACRTKWVGDTLILGTMYSYDIFAAAPCCAQRTACKNCRQTIMDPSCSFNFYSAYSRPIQCPYCKVEDFHFIKDLQESFRIKQPICK